MTKPRRSATASEGCNAEEQSRRPVGAQRTRRERVPCERGIPVARSGTLPARGAKGSRRASSCSMPCLAATRAPRLLRTAIVRRDEVLIDAVLGQLRMLP